MATEDKLVRLSGLGAAYSKLSGEINGLNATIDYMQSVDINSKLYDTDDDEIAPSATYGAIQSDGSFNPVDNYIRTGFLQFDDDCRLIFDFSSGFLAVGTYASDGTFESRSGYRSPFEFFDIDHTKKYIISWKNGEDATIEPRTFSGNLKITISGSFKSQIKTLSNSTSSRVTHFASSGKISIVPPIGTFTDRGVTWTSDGAKTQFTGTIVSPQWATYAFYDNANALPYGIEAGEEYNISISGDPNVIFQVYAYENGVLSGDAPIAQVSNNSESTFTIGNDVTGLLVRLRNQTEGNVSGTVIPLITAFPGIKEIESELAGLTAAATTMNGEISSIRSVIPETTRYAKTYIPATITAGHCVNLNGNVIENETYGYFSIPVQAGDVIKTYPYTNNNDFAMRTVTAYDSNGTAQSAKGQENTVTFTVPTGIVSLTITVKTTTYSYFYCLRERGYTANVITAESKLYGKTVYGFGDSLVYGHYMAIGMIDKLAWECGLTYTKYAVNGASVVYNNSRISAQIENASSVIPDYVVFDGFINDCYDTVVSNSLGTITSSYTDTDFDTTTFCGSFEHICYLLRTKYLTANILYVLTHKVPTRTEESQIALSEKIKAICAKWGITIVNIYDEGQINTNISVMRNEYSYNALTDFKNGNGTHLNVDGYDKWYSPAIKAAMIAKL